jgi:hypothetical protein
LSEQTEKHWDFGAGLQGKSHGEGKIAGNVEQHPNY